MLFAPPEEAGNVRSPKELARPVGLLTLHNFVRRQGRKLVGFLVEAESCSKTLRGGL